MWTRLLYILVINLITFGGGPVYIPVYQDFYVNFGIATIEEYYAIVAINNAFPGVVGGKLSGYAMFVEYGYIGFILAIIMFSIPSIIIMRIALSYFNKMKKSKYFKNISHTTTPAIMAILFVISVNFVVKSFEGLSIYLFAFFTMTILILMYKKVKIYNVIYLTLFMSTLIYVFQYSGFSFT